MPTLFILSVLIFLLLSTKTTERQQVALVDYQRQPGTPVLHRRQIGPLMKISHVHLHSIQALFTVKAAGHINDVLVRARRSIASAGSHVRQASPAVLFDDVLLYDTHAASVVDKRCVAGLLDIAFEVVRFPLVDLS